MKNIALDHNAAMGHLSCVNVMLAMGADVSLPFSSQHLNYTLLQRVALVVLKDKKMCFRLVWRSLSSYWKKELGSQIIIMIVDILRLNV